MRLFEQRTPSLGRDKSRIPKSGWLAGRPANAVSQVSENVSCPNVCLGNLGPVIRFREVRCQPLYELGRGSTIFASRNPQDCLRVSRFNQAIAVAHRFPNRPRPNQGRILAKLRDCGEFGRKFSAVEKTRPNGTFRG